jgi:hypothetical protein
MKGSVGILVRLESLSHHPFNYGSSDYAPALQTTDASPRAKARLVEVDGIEVFEKKSSIID